MPKPGELLWPIEKFELLKLLSHDRKALARGGGTRRLLGAALNERNSPYFAQKSKCTRLRA